MEEANQIATHLIVKVINIRIVTRLSHIPIFTKYVQSCENYRNFTIVITLLGNQHFEFPPRPLLQVASQASSYTDPGDCFNFDKIQYEYTNPFRLRIGAQKKAPGFHAELVCLTPWVNGEAPTQISCLELSSNYGLMAYGNMAGLVIVDVVQNLCLLNMGTADLYGAAGNY